MNFGWLRRYRQIWRTLIQLNVKTYEIIYKHWHLRNVWGFFITCNLYSSLDGADNILYLARPTAGGLGRPPGPCPPASSCTPSPPPRWPSASAWWSVLWPGCCPCSLCLWSRGLRGSDCGISGGARAYIAPSSLLMRESRPRRQRWWSCEQNFVCLGS